MPLPLSFSGDSSEIAAEPSHRALSSLFTASLPQTNCSYGHWPKDELVCSDSAVDCINNSCVCAAGWTGRVDYVSSDDCHININLYKTCLLIFMISAILEVAILSLWNAPALRDGYRLFRKGKKVTPKTLAYFWFIWEGIWAVIGLIYQLFTSSRIGYDFIVTAFMAGDINFFLVASYYFLKSWVQIQHCATSKSSKKESEDSARHIVKVLRYKLTFLCSCITLSLFLMLFVSDEISIYREHLSRSVNLLIACCSFAAGVSLFRSGRVLGRALGDDDSNVLSKLGTNMLFTTNIISAICIFVTVVLLCISLISFIIQYNMLVISVNFSLSFMAPIVITLLLETPPWSKRKIRVSTAPSSSRRENQVGIVLSKELGKARSSMSREMSWKRARSSTTPTEIA